MIFVIMKNIRRHREIILDNQVSKRGRRGASPLFLNNQFMRIHLVCINSLFLIIVFSLCSMTPVAADESPQTTSAFIPVYQGFDFVKGKIVDQDEGQINVLPHGIETNFHEVEIAFLRKGFIEDINSISPEELLWSDFEEYVVDMIYIVRSQDEHYTLFELIDVKISDEQVLGIEIKYENRVQHAQNK